MGGPRRDRQQHERGAAAGAADGRASGLPQREVALAPVHRAHLPRFDIPPAVRAIYPDLAHARDWEQAIAATSFVPDEVIAQLCETFGLVGTAEHCARRVVEMAPAGVTNLFVQAFQTFLGPDQELRAFRDEVFPRLTAAGYR